MKKWVRPLTTVQLFTANEYVAACGDIDDSQTVYKFKCDAPEGNVYAENEGWLGGYHPCGKVHEAKTTETFEKGYVDRNGNRQMDSGEEAIIWVEKHHGLFGTYVTNWHATTALDMSQWEIAKS